MISSSQIRPDAPVVCSKDGQFGVVDHMEGSDTIKLKKDKQGQHHFIPLSWVKSVDNKVHIDRPGDQAMKEWATTAPQQGQTFTFGGDKTKSSSEPAKGGLKLADMPTSADRKRSSSN